MWGNGARGALGAADGSTEQVHMYRSIYIYRCKYVSMYMHIYINIYIWTYICGATVRGGRWVLLMAALSRYTCTDLYIYIDVNMYLCICIYI